MELVVTGGAGLIDSSRAAPSEPLARRRMSELAAPPVVIDEAEAIEPLVEGRRCLNPAMS